MGLLDNLYHRTILPGDLIFRRRAGVVQSPREIAAAFGSRVQIARPARRLVPYGLDYEAGHDDRRGHSVVVHPPPGGPPGGPPGPPPPHPPPPGPQPAAPGYRRVFNFNFTADTAGSDPTFEIRLTPPIGFPFHVTELTITPLAGVTVGQYLDILVLPNADMADAGVFLGSSLFENLALVANIPVPDGTHAIAVPITTLRLEDLGPVFSAGQQIKAVLFFVPPAFGMAQIAVTLVVQELVADTALPPPRDPPDPPPYPGPPEPPPPGPPPEPEPGIDVVYLGAPPFGFSAYPAATPFTAYQRANLVYYVTKAPSHYPADDPVPLNAYSVHSFNAFAAALDAGDVTLF